VRNSFNAGIGTKSGRCAAKTVFLTGSSRDTIFNDARITRWLD